MAYKLTHPDSNQEIERDAADVPMYLSQGWEKKPHAKDPETDQATTATSKE